MATGTEDHPPGPGDPIFDWTRHGATLRCLRELRCTCCPTASICKVCGSRPASGEYIEVRCYRTGEGWTCPSPRYDYPKKILGWPAENRPTIRETVMILVPESYLKCPNNWIVHRYVKGEGSKTVS